MPARRRPAAPGGGSCAGPGSSGAHARAGRSRGPQQPAAGLSSPAGWRRSTPEASGPGSLGAPLVPSLRSRPRRAPRSCAPSRGRGTSEAPGRPRPAPAPGPAPRARPRRSLRTPSPTREVPLAPRSRPGQHLRPGRAPGARIPPGRETRRHGGGPGAGPRDYFSFESFRGQKFGPRLRKDPAVVAAALGDNWQRFASQWQRRRGRRREKGSPRGALRYGSWPRESGEEQPRPNLGDPETGALGEVASLAANWTLV